MTDPTKGCIRSVLREDAVNLARAIMRLPIRIFWAVLWVLGVFLAIEIVTGPWQLAEYWAAEAKRKDGLDRSYLCEMAAACRKYSDAREQCATAGNLRTCVHIKMGDDSFFADQCSAYEIGAPAVPTPPETPSRITCFLLQTPHWGR